MEDRGLRDIERWRDKIEVRLDNRQVFFLFFGSALVACMLFVLGVIVGKRLESRGRAVSPEIEDPLALLDKVATSPRPAQGGVTLPQALFGTNSKVASGDKGAKKSVAPAIVENAGEPTKPAAAKPAAAKPTETGANLSGEGKPEAKPEGKPAVAAVEETKEEKKEEKKPAAVKPADKPAEAAAEEKNAEQKPEVAPAKAKPAVDKKDGKKLELAQAKPKSAEPKESKPVAIPTIAAGGESKSKGRFALQLSSFQDKAEAEAFAQKFSGERPYMVMSDIPGKGIWYRVRVGDYASAKDAIAAKDAFEKKHNVIAYVAQK